MNENVKVVKEAKHISSWGNAVYVIRLRRCRDAGMQGCRDQRGGVRGVLARIKKKGGGS